MMTLLLLFFTRRLHNLILLPWEHATREKNVAIIVDSTAKAGVGEAADTVTEELVKHEEGDHKEIQWKTGI